MNEKFSQQAASINRYNAIATLTRQACDIIEKITKDLIPSANDEISNIAKQLDSLDPEKKDQNLQLLIGAVETVPETITNLCKYPQFSKQNSFFQKQIQLSIPALAEMGKFLEKNDQENFDRNYVIFLLSSYKLDVYEGSLILTEAIDHLKHSPEDKNCVKKLELLYSEHLPQAEFSKGSNGRVLVRSLNLALKTFCDFWIKASEEQRNAMLTDLEVMGNHIIPMLYQPRYESLDMFKEAFERIRDTGNSIMQAIKKAEARG